MAHLGVKLQELLDEGSIPYKQNSKSFVLSCPRCGKAQKLYLRKADGRFVCWVCNENSGFSGKAEWVLTELLGTDIATLRRELYGVASGPTSLYLDLVLEDFFDEDDEIPMFVPETQLEVLADPGFRPLPGSPGEEYLAKRGVPLALAEKYKIAWWPAKNSIVFPVISRGKMIGWQTRILGPSEWYDEESNTTIRVPKAITSTGLKKERTFMFGDNLEGSRHAILCEGPFDAIKTDLCGGGVASLGKLVSPTQLQLLKLSGIERLYLALDPDAFMEASRLMKELRALMENLEVYDMRPPDQYSDLGEMPLDEVKDLMDSAPRLYPQHIFMYLKDIKEHYA
jgi:hypothetical protein